MKNIIENQKFNTQLETSDWRYSASIVGLIKYFDYLEEIGEDIESNLYKIEHDTISYHSDAITEERYFMFVESYFKEYMHHRSVEDILCGDTFTAEEIKLVNDKLKANAIMKKVFGALTFGGENKESILQKIDENRLLLIKETYRTGKSLYANFASTNSLGLEQNGICRLQNYNIDTGKKSKSISYNWNFNTYNFEDEKEFDFIPFAFSKSYESFFINNNYSIKQLLSTNQLICDSENPRSTLFDKLKKSADFMIFDVEVIVKNRNTEYFETLYIRKDATTIFEKIENYKAIQMRYKVNDNYSIYFEKEVTNNILNKMKLDTLIEMLLKADSNYSYNIKTLIKINTLIYGGDTMNEQMENAKKCAKKVKKEFMKKNQENKINSYKQKLISAITFRDSERFCEILLQLSAYSGVVFEFAYPLFEDFNENKNIAYTFINALNKESSKDNGGEINE